MPVAAGAIQNNTSAYVQGVEVPLSYTGPVPEGFDTTRRPYLMFQGEPSPRGVFPPLAFRPWIDMIPPPSDTDDENPRIQLEPRSKRGYINKSGKTK
ncbi:MAG: hypothetical protein ACLT0Y_08570 [Christensenellales bacterium]